MVFAICSPDKEIKVAATQKTHTTYWLCILQVAAKPRGLVVILTLFKNESILIYGTKAYMYSNLCVHAIFIYACLYI